MWSRRSKYHAKKTVVDGITFDSKREADRYLVLKSMEEDGTIEDLQRQVRIELVPPFDRNGQHFRGIYYVVDFVYTGEDGNAVWEDVKGMKTSVYLIKRKLVAYRYGKVIKET
nr:MAG: protein of unknown function (DUF1064) [Bacteriophage sp.]